MCRLMNLSTVIIAMITMASLNSLRGEDANVEEALPLTGKLVLVQMSSKPVFYLIENARIVELAGKTMVTGRFVPTGETAAHTWTKGLPFGVSWSPVETVIVFDSVEQYQTRLKLMTPTYTPSSGSYQPRRTDTAPRLNADEIQSSTPPSDTPPTRSSNP
jgi:hypothetical protein